MTGDCRLTTGAMGGFSPDHQLQITNLSSQSSLWCFFWERVRSALPESVPWIETASLSLETLNLRSTETSSGDLSCTASRHMAINPRSESSSSCRVSASLERPLAESSRESPRALAWIATRDTDVITPMMAMAGSPLASPETWTWALRFEIEG